MQNQAYPKISIITPVLNGGATLEKAIQSLVSQDYPNLEYIIFDAGSTDNTVEIIKRYESFVTYWHSKPDGNSNIAINQATQQATGDIVATLMADDWYEPGTLHAIAAASNSNPKADMITCGGRIVFFDAAKQNYLSDHVFTGGQTLALNFYNICYGASVICCRFIKKDFFAKNGYFLEYDQHGKHIFSSDKEFLLRAVLNQVNNVVVDHLGYNYLAHQGSATFGKNHKNIIKLCREHMETAELFLQKPQLQDRQFFMGWYCDQSVRLVIFNLLDGEFRLAWCVAKEGFSKFSWRWVKTLFTTPMKIIIKKLRYLRADLLHKGLC